MRRAGKCFSPAKSRLRRLAAFAGAVLLVLCLAAPEADAKGAGGGGRGGAHSSTRSSGASHASARSTGGRAGNSAHAPKSSAAARASARRNSSASTQKSAPASPKAVPGVARDSHGRIARSQRAKNDFKKQSPCPSTGRSSGACPGYVVDHVKPLKRGGADHPSNMQWQTAQAAKQKDKTE